MTHSQVTVTSSTYSHVDGAKQPSEHSLPPKKIKISDWQMLCKFFSLENTLSCSKQIRKPPGWVQALNQLQLATQVTPEHKVPMRSPANWQHDYTMMISLVSLNNFDINFYDTLSFTRAREYLHTANLSANSATEWNVLAWQNWYALNINTEQEPGYAG